MLWDQSYITELLSGRVYGISKFGNTWFCVHIQDKVAFLTSFEITENQIHSIKPLVECSIGIHQIDFVGHQLVMADTRNNRIVFCDQLGIELRAIYPNGKKPLLDFNEDHLHLNSVFCYDNIVYVIAHNLSVKYSRPSELYMIDMKNYNINSHLSLHGSEVHNVYVNNDDILYLDSFSGKIILNDKDVAQYNGFLRGLSITDDFYIIGANMRASRNDRSYGSIVIFDKSFHLVEQHDINAAIFEIRCLDSPDYSMSNTSN